MEEADGGRRGPAPWPGERGTAATAAASSGTTRCSSATEAGTAPASERRLPDMAAIGEFGVRQRPEEADGYELDEDDDDGGGDGDGFTLDEVLRLGGTKQDFLMLCALDEAEEMVDGGKKGAIDDLKDGELEAFIGSLGLGKYAKSCLQEEESENEEKKGSKENEKTVKKEKSKKEKNKEKSKENNKEKSKKETVSPSSERKKEKKAEEQVSSRKDSKKKPAGGDPRQQQSVQKERLEEDFTFRAREVILIKPGGKWYDFEYTAETSAEPQDPALLSQYKALAQKLYQHETELFKNKTEYQKRASSAWMKTVVSSGTLADRMAAMTLLIQDSAVHSLHFIENLVNLVKKKGSRQQSLMALDTFRELLLSDLLPDTRKLWSFSQRPFNNIEKMSSGNRDSRDRRLILWYFEHQLKLQVAEFVQTLEVLSHDSLTATKTRALAAAHELLCNKPEQEKFLLVQLVNKLGDPHNKIATKASYLLETLLHKHPNMKGVVCGEVERLLYRSNISAKTQYYAMCFLNQMVLSHEETPLANKLITLYFCFFRNCIKKKDVESKMLSALLSGVNRAYPYAEIGDEKVKEQMNTLFKVLHLVNFNTSVQALMLLFQVMDSQQTVSDRYYTALYKKLLDPGLATCSKPSMFLNLVYKSLKADVVLRRVKAFVKRLLQVTAGQAPSFICGTLYLLSEILKVKPGLRVQLQDHVESDEEECFKDQEEAEEDEETFLDADKVEGEEMSATENSTKTNNLSSAASWVHHQNLGGRKNGVSYDPFHRSPLYCGAESTSLWELKKLSEHFHPSVALFAKTILEGNHIQYSGDPLQDFTLMRFLDRFVYRNPKLHKGKENTSSVVMQRKKKQFMMSTQNLAVNSKEFLAKDESKIPVDELFFHRFYTKFDKMREKRRRQDDEESVEDVDDDEFERALDAFEADDSSVGVNQDDLDFAGNIKKKSDGNKKSKRSEDSGDDWDDSDDEEFSDLDDEEVSLGSMEEGDFEEDMDEEGGVFMDVSDDDNSPDLNNDNQSKSVSKKTKRKKDMNFLASREGSSQGKKRKLKDAKILAAAEEIGYLLDENAGSKFDNIGMNAMANRDNANIKQIKWEIERDRWLHNRDAKSIIKRKKQFRHAGLKKKYRGKKGKR